MNNYLRKTLLAVQFPVLAIFPLLLGASGTNVVFSSTLIKIIMLIYLTVLLPTMVIQHFMIWELSKVVKRTKYKVQIGIGLQVYLTFSHIMLFMFLYFLETPSQSITFFCIGLVSSVYLFYYSDTLRIFNNKFGGKNVY